MQTAYRLSTRTIPTEDHSARRIINDNIETLKQGINLIARLDDHLYTQPNHELSLSGVGAHFRHCIDFYRNFLNGVESGRIGRDEGLSR